MNQARLHCRAVSTGSLALCAAIFTVLPVSPQPVSAQNSGDEFLTVDCLLPGQVRKLGRKLIFLAPRRPVRTSQTDCEIRGGEYVSYDRASYGNALQIWLPLAQKGDVKAQTYIGEMAEKGLGEAVDYELAALWYRRAAKQGYAPAQTNLGHLYEKGLGVPKDMKTAIMWYRRASDLDVAGFEQVAFGDPIEEIQKLETSLRQRTGEVEALRAEMAGLKQEFDQAKEERRRVSMRLAKETEALQAERRALAQQQRIAVPRRKPVIFAQTQLAGSLAKAEVELGQKRQELEERESELAKSELDLKRRLRETEHGHRDARYGYV